MYLNLGHIPNLRFHSRTIFLTMNPKRNKGLVLVQFCSGVLLSRFETGRFVSEQVHGRLCKLCCQSTVLDKTHFFFLYCSFYTNLMKYELAPLINDGSFMNKNDTDKISDLLKDNKRRTAKFLLKANLQRRSKLFTYSNTILSNILKSHFIIIVYTFALLCYMIYLIVTCRPIRSGAFFAIRYMYLLLQRMSL